jgi:hypothetical protein
VRKGFAFPLVMLFFVEAAPRSAAADVEGAAFENKKATVGKP